MSKVRVESFTISLDGYGAGPGQDLDNSLGIGGTALHAWAMTTRTFQRAVFGKEEGTTEGIDEAYREPDPLMLARSALPRLR